MISRYYSAIFCNFHEWAEKLRALGYRIADYPQLKPGRLKFIYKTYIQGKLSQSLNSFPKHHQINLKGPLGPGLYLSKFTGNFIACAAGTGLVPFLDLIYHIYSSQAKNISFTLIASFRYLKDIFALDLLEATASELGHDKFKLVIITEDKKENLESILKENLKTHMNLAWVCGPSGYNHSIKSLLKSSGLPRNKIIVL